MYTNQFSFDDERKIEFNEVTEAEVEGVYMKVFLENRGTEKVRTIYIVNNLQTRTKFFFLFEKNSHFSAINFQ